MSDVVARLRKSADYTPMCGQCGRFASVCRDAAAEIERLRAELARLCDRGTLQALRDANDRAEQAERERDEARAVAEKRGREYDIACRNWQEARRKRDEARAELDRVGRKNADAERPFYDMVKVRAERDEALALLRKCEWLPLTTAIVNRAEQQCPWCLHRRRARHGPNCPFDALLGGRDE